jgi:ABC-type uncharacterized transport system permease subunit
MIAGLLFEAVAGLILLFWAHPAKLAVAFLLGISGAALVFSPLSRPSTALIPAAKHKLAANIVVCGLMLTVVIVGMVKVFSH